MKKTVAIFFGLFAIAMMVMVGWGFIDKQTKESATNQVQQNSTPEKAPSQQSKPSTQQDSQSNSTKSVSASELAKHNKPSDCWLGINGGVYDVTNYVDMHPGGADIVLMYCGKDATRAYNTRGGRGSSHSSRADTQLAQYKIGELK